MVLIGTSMDAGQGRRALRIALMGALTWVFAALAVALVAYGTLIVAVLASGAWFRGGEGRG